MRRIFYRNGQSTLEYAILIAVVVGGLIGMQTYVKRGLQGRLRDAADDIGSQYSPGNVSGTFTTTLDNSTTETVKDGVTTTKFDSEQTRTGSETVADLSSEEWPD